MKIIIPKQFKKIVFIFLLLFILLTSLYIIYADSSAASRVYVWVCDDSTGCAYPGILGSSGSGNIYSYNVGSVSSPHSTLCGYEGSKYVKSSSICETAGTTYSSPSYRSIYDIDWDGDQNDCECYGKTWFTNHVFP